MLRAFARAGGTLGVLALLWPSMSFAWGDEGHRIVALVAAKILSTDSPETLQKLNSILATDSPAAWPGANVSVGHDIASEVPGLTFFARTTVRAKRLPNFGISWTSTTTNLI